MIVAPAPCTFGMGPLRGHYKAQARDLSDRWNGGLGVRRKDGSSCWERHHSKGA